MEPRRERRPIDRHPGPPSLPWRIALLGVMIALTAAPPLADADLTDAWVEDAKLTASDGDDWDHFGWDVAVDGDTALVGSPWDTGQEAAYVYERQPSGVWGETALLRPDDGDLHFAEYGFSVDLEGDTAVVGAWALDFPGGGGATYVFTRNATGAWNQQANLTPADPAPDQGFGYAVDLDDDRLVAGAPFTDTHDGENAGAGYVFDRDGSGSWNQVANLTASDGQGDGGNPDHIDGDWFGWSAAVDDETVLLGAPNADNGTVTTAGAGYVYSGTGGSWSETAKLTPAGPGGGHDFGEGASLDGDRALVGADSARNADGVETGAAYVFERSAPGTWSQTGKLTPRDGSSQDDFGLSVDLDGATAVAGARNHDLPIQNVGAAYVYSPDVTGEWTRDAKLQANDGQPWHGLGWSVAVDDGRVAAGAPHASPGTTTRAGAAYVFDEVVQRSGDDVKDATQDDAGSGGDASDDPDEPTPLPGGQHIWVNGTVAPEADDVDAYGTEIAGNTTRSMNFTFDAPLLQNITVTLYDPDDNLVDRNTTGLLGGNATVRVDAGDGNLTAGTWTTVLELQDPLPGLPSLLSGSSSPTAQPTTDRNLHEGFLLSEEEDDEEDEDYEGERRCDPNC